MCLSNAQELNQTFCVVLSQDIDFFWAGKNNIHRQDCSLQMWVLQVN